MGRSTCGRLYVILTFSSSALKLWSSPWKLCPRHYFETINVKCFIFSGHINRAWDMCNTGSFYLFNFDLDIMTFILKILCSQLQKTICSVHCSAETQYIFPRHINIQWNFYTVWSVWPLTLKQWSSSWFKENLVWVIRWKLFMESVLYDHGPSWIDLFCLDNWKCNIGKRKISSDSNYRDTNWWKSQQFLTVKLF